MISPPEQRRVRILEEMMRERGISALLVSRRENVRYLTGFTGSAGWALVAGGRPLLITDFRYRLQADREAPGVSLFIQKKDIASALQQASARRGIGTIWFDESSLTLEQVRAFRKKGLRLKGCKDPVSVLRRIKGREELACIKKAVQRAEKSFLELKRHIKPGISERELGLRLEYLIREKGSRRAAFDIIVASGGNGAMPHASATDKRIKKGELVTIDFGAEADGYYSDITRTVCVGKPSSRQREIHELVLRAQAAAISEARPGASCKSVDAAARGIIKKSGQGKNFGHATGHGIGLAVHEGPAVSAQSKDIVKKDMVFTIEPGVYIPGWGGVRIEDMVLVNSGGAKALTTLPRDL